MAIILGMMTKKGGAGKSTLTKLLASAVVFSGHKCLVIDLDPNEDILTWWTSATEQGNHDDRLTVRATLNSEDLFELVDEHDEKVEFILIDTKGEGADWADHLASVSDRLIVPCLNSRSDAERTRETLQWYSDLKTRVDDPASVPPLHVVLTRMPTSLLSYDGRGTPKGMTGNDMARYKAMVQEFRPLKSIVPERSQYRDMDERGLLGTLLDQARNGEWKDKGQALHYESALAHATDLMNCILTGETMETVDGA